jgi:23S rRNA pseudouridine1911/1915/1917 synthase
MNELFYLQEEEDNRLEWYEHHRIKVDAGQEPMRIDKFLTQRLPHVSRSKIQNAIKAGSILVNDKTTKNNYLVKPNDVIRVLLPKPPVEIHIFPQNIPINIIYEDELLIVINKEAGMVVHPGYNNYDKTLLHALLYHFEKTNQQVQPYLVHRIDKDTSGVIVVAKDEFAQIHLAKQFFEHSIHRKYIALIWGNLDEEEGIIEGYIGRSPKDRRQFILYDDESRGKYSKTFYRVLERYGFATLVECTLATGRTHQIRTHFTHMGHPLFGDPLYGGQEIKVHSTSPKFRQFIQNLLKDFQRQALHAQELGFIHPQQQSWVLFSTPLPADMEKILLKIRMYVQN